MQTSAIPSSETVAALEPAAGESVVPADIVFDAAVSPAAEKNAIAALLQNGAPGALDGIQFRKSYVSATGKSCVILTASAKPTVWYACRSDDGFWVVRTAFFAPDSMFGVAL